MKRIIMFLCVFLLVGCGCEKTKIKEEKSKIIIDVGTPSDAYISISPISDTIVELEIGKKFKLLKTILGKKIKNHIVIENNSMLQYKDGEIIAVGTGETSIYFVSKDKKTKSNVLKVLVK